MKRNDNKSLLPNIGWKGRHLLFTQQQILACGFGQPKFRPFMGAIGETFYKLYKPFLPYKDELAIWERKVKKGKK